MAPLKRKQAREAAKANSAADCAINRRDAVLADAAAKARAYLDAQTFSTRAENVTGLHPRPIGR